MKGVISYQTGLVDDSTIIAVLKIDNNYYDAVGRTKEEAKKKVIELYKKTPKDEEVEL